MQNVWNPAEVIDNIAAAVEKACDHDVPVIWVQHSDDELVFGSTEWQLVPGLSPSKGEIQIYKNFNSLFEGISLDDQLANDAAAALL